MLTISQQTELIIGLEKDADEGIKRIMDKVRKDFNAVFHLTPTLTESIQNSHIVIATLNDSPYLETLIKDGNLDVSQIKDKKEVYQIEFVNEQLLIIGSDKLGTIYGMFHLSEEIGVSPLHFWGDRKPQRREFMVVTKAFEKVSKEPSIKYRGFFINDEWPCFGNWTFHHFGGFTAKMYDHVFELLLRLKGNYLWPAMWTSSFGLDGPGAANEELADMYGITMGKSHHEPMLRASEEWDVYRGPDSEYGNDWCYFTNKEELNQYWEDGVKRSGKYKKITMLGMRGERDSEILGEDSPLKDNIDLLKDVITNQRRILAEHGNPDNPEMLAIYKEVEAYFYGDAQTEGLKDWDGLGDAILMFCEDNFGFVRTLPTEDLGHRRYGMYYHFDYHGGPISYEWMPSTAYERTWEQMSMAYDYGIRDVWIVNVGDLKFNEVLLNYFMDLAYDFEQWGTSAPNQIDRYKREWVAKNFSEVDADLQAKMKFVFENFLKLNSWRRPEAMNADIYHAAHYLETDRILNEVEAIEVANREVYEALEGHTWEAYHSMIGFPATASTNLIKMHLYSAKNEHYAKQGKKVAKHYRDLVTAAIEKDYQLFKEFAEFKAGKWKGMELEEHIGFTTWNEDGSKYPLRYTVEPVHKPRLLVSRKDETATYHKDYFNNMAVQVDDFLWAGSEEVIIEIANDGTGELVWQLEGDIPKWLTLNKQKGIVASQTELILKVDPQHLTATKQHVRLFIKAACASLVDEFEVGGFKMHDVMSVPVDIYAQAVNQNYPKMTHLPNKGILVINAKNYLQLTEVDGAQFVHLEKYGRSGSGMKVYPTMKHFDISENAPTLTYQFLTGAAGDYKIEFWSTPTNPLRNHTPMRFGLEIGGNTQVIETVPADFVPFHSDERWCQGVLDNIRKTEVSARFESGVQQLTVKAMDAGFILERILIYTVDNKPKPSYLGPPDSTVLK